MASSTKNVKLGVCQVFFDGVDLGYTKGGVDVSVKTDTHKVNIDQFGKTPINEYVMGREVMVKCPLAETTLENLVRIMPGATLVHVGAAAATGTITIASLPTTGQTILINGKTVTFRTKGTANPGANEVDLDTTATLVATNLRSFINGTSEQAIASVTASGTTAVTTLTADTKGFAGNSFTLATGTAAAAVTMSAATMTGGLNGTGAARVDVPTGIGVSLLDIARSLVLRPVGKLDASEDFTVYQAATAGQLQFAYKLEDERIFSCEFNGYPDATGRLFAIGDPVAV